MLAPRASSSADARVASILSIERDMSVVRPANKRALVSLKSALDTVRLFIVVLHCIGVYSIRRRESVLLGQVVVFEVWDS